MVLKAQIPIVLISFISWLPTDASVAQQPAGVSQAVVLAGGDPYCDPVSPAVAPQPLGGIVAAWRDDSGVFAQQFDSRGTALGAAVRLRHPEGPEQFHPKVAVAPDGRTGVIWSEHRQRTLAALILSAKGVIESQRIELADDLDGSVVPALAATSDGAFTAFWRQGDTLRVARFGVDGVEDARMLPPGPEGCPPTELVAASRSGGDPILAWLEECPEPLSTMSLFVQRLDASGHPEGPSVEISSTGAAGLLSDVDMAVDGSDRLAVVWNESADRSFRGFRTFLQRLGPDDKVLGLRESATGTDAPSFTLDPALAADPTGNLLVVWRTNDSVHARTLFADGSRSEPVAYPGGLPHSLQVVAGGSGTGLIVWTEFSGFIVDPLPPCVATLGIFGRRVSFGGDHALLLRDGRFRVEVFWQDPFNGGNGLGHTIPGSDDTGSFWFFDPANVELVTKVLDGREVNGHFWFFSGALSNVTYGIRVTDLPKSRFRLYTNLPGQLQSRADTEAFEALDELDGPD